MRMKEDAMLNGQLKPAYKFRWVDSEYITWIDISPRPTDSTLIPFLKDMEATWDLSIQKLLQMPGTKVKKTIFSLKATDRLLHKATEL